jgi:hypothetical protein
VSCIFILYSAVGDLFSICTPSPLSARRRTDRRRTSVPIDGVRLYDFPNGFSSFSPDKLSRIPRFSFITPSKGVHKRDISVLPGTQVPRRRWSWCCACHHGRWVIFVRTTRDWPILTDVCFPTFPAGDVSLSAEDRPPYYLIYRPPAIERVPPILHDIRPSKTEDFDDDEDEDLLLEEHHHIEDDHHGWLGGTTALKYLVAGGVAGTGRDIARIYQLLSTN